MEWNLTERAKTADDKTFCESSKTDRNRASDEKNQYIRRDPLTVDVYKAYHGSWQFSQKDSGISLARETRANIYTHVRLYLVHASSEFISINT